MHNQSQTLTLLILKDKIEDNSGNDGKKEDTNLDPILINFLFNLINLEIVISSSCSLLIFLSALTSTTLFALLC